MVYAQDTIAAVASPPGAGRRGVLRISGPAARALGAQVLGRDLPLERAHFGARFDDGEGSQPVLVLWMPGPSSYTGEDVLELHLPGAPLLLALALERLLRLGARAAGPGEFTRRAFLNGRIDLSRAEGVLALIEAHSAGERRAASRLLAGGLAREVQSLREQLDELRALCEASLDFDELDTGHVPREELLRLARGLRVRLACALEEHGQRRRASGLPRVTLAGAPNAGKSALFNALTQAAAQAAPQPRALVSDFPGSTRELLEASLRLPGGSWCLVSDSPGLVGESLGSAGDSGGALLGHGALEQRVQERARQAQANSEALLWVVNAAAGGAERQVQRALEASGPPRLVLWAQVDRQGVGACPEGALPLSSHTGLGLAPLLVALETLLAGAADGPGQARELHERHRLALARGREHLQRALNGLESASALDLVAEELREASQALDQIEGRTSTEDLLDRIFARFCLGK